MEPRESEAEEEMGYRIKEVRKIAELYLSPASVSELMHFYLAEYEEDMKVGEGGGLKGEKEYIEVVEIPLERAKQMMDKGEIKDIKSVVLLQYVLLHVMQGNLASSLIK